MGNPDAQDVSENADRCGPLLDEGTQALKGVCGRLADKLLGKCNVKWLKSERHKDLVYEKGRGDGPLQVVGWEEQPMHRHAHPFEDDHSVKGSLKSV